MFDQIGVIGWNLGIEIKMGERFPETVKEGVWT